MIDDPLGLTVQMIAVLAAGMYPVGFLFGVCSDCCGGCPPCTKCNHYYNQSGCRSVDSFTATIAGYGTLTTLFINEFEAGDCLDGVEPELELTNDFNPECGGGPYTVNAQLRFDVPFSSDDCGCEQRVFDGEVLLVFTPGANTVSVGFVDNGETLLCSPKTVTLTASLADATDAPGACQQDFAYFADNLSISASFDIAACDCGACCDDGCEDDVAEGGCGNWAGVGTACDDDPNPCE
jgi:hypothetical protein